MDTAVYLCFIGFFSILSIAWGITNLFFKDTAWGVKKQLEVRRDVYRWPVQRNRWWELNTTFSGIVGLLLGFAGLCGVMISMVNSFRIGYSILGIILGCAGLALVFRRDMIWNHYARNRGWVGEQYKSPNWNSDVLFAGVLLIVLSIVFIFIGLA